MINSEQDIFECSCGHCSVNKKHNSKEKSNFIKENLTNFILVVFSSICLIVSLFFTKNKLIGFLISLVGFLSIFSKHLIGYIKGLKNKSVFNELLLMIIASIVAFCLGEYFEAIIVLVLFTIGESLEDYATLKAKKQIGGLAHLKTNMVRLITRSCIIEADPLTVEIGSLIEVRKGDCVAIDGILLDKSASLDLKSLTGESNSVFANCGNEILAGSINIGDSFVIKTIRLYKESATEKIISVVTEALDKKSKSQKFINKFAKVYTPTVFVIAILVALITPLIDGFNFNKWIYKALSFLVVSCPCSLVISVPLAFFIGLGSLAKKGVLVKGTNYIEVLSKTKFAVFDKTGTLTKGELKVGNIEVYNHFNLEVVIDYAVCLERHSSHPIAKALTNLKKVDFSTYSITEIKEFSGQGISGKINGNVVLLGNKSLLKNYNLLNVSDSDNTCIFLVINNLVAGSFELIDCVKENALESINNLKKVGVNEVAIISGDKKTIAEKIGKKLNIEKVYAELLPEQKLHTLNNIINQNLKGKTIYVGDGINDSPALASSDVGIAMGMLGSDIAVESADVIIMDDNLNKIPITIKQSKKITNVVYQNIITSLIVKVAVMICSIFIKLPVWVAVFSDVGLLLLTILNSLRCSKVSRI